VQDFNFGVVPQHCADVDDAYVRLRSAGAVILTNAGTSRDDARALAQRILAPLSPIVPDPARIKEGGGNRDRSYITSRLNESFAVTFSPDTPTALPTATGIRTISSCSA
jgi:hypothetical protein